MKKGLIALVAVVVAACSSNTAPTRSMKAAAAQPESRDYICVADPGNQQTYGTCDTQDGLSGYIVFSG